ncbi:MAG TPA: serine/threonine-protein kinase [Gaiellaceae bacterium]|nr:serine/threonine-protein kinase [Gaiellaceae bacterium]
MSDVTWIPRIGDEFAGYRLVSLIGHGGMSIVYRAEHIGLERSVALKLLSPQLSEDADFRERFQRESKVAAALEHPNIIPIYEAGEEQGVLYIAMRYVEGADLKSRLKQGGPLEAPQLAALISQVAAALEAAHEKGLIHRDVKPANILIAVGAGVEGADHAYLSDFGVAKNTAAAGVTKTGLFVGTADYASPEQIEGKPLDGRADIYSLGCVAYEALTATPTYAKDSEVAMMYAHLLEPPPKLTEKRPDLPGEVDEVIAKAVAKSKEDRYARPMEFAIALRQAFAGTSAPAAAAVAPQPGAGETVLAGAPPAGGQAQAQAAPPAAPPPAAAETAPAGTGGGGGANRKKMLVGGAILAAAIAAVLIAVFAIGGGKSSSDKGTDTTAATTTTGGGGGGSGTATTLLAVLAPTQVTKECTAQNTRAPDAVETDLCVSAPTDPTSQPDQFQLSFYRSSQALLHAYGQELKKGKGSLTKCGSAAAGERPWIHPTGKRGGRFFCYQDPKGNFVLVWTHEKLGSDDHVDMLGWAQEPGRAPTIVGGWWSSLNDSIGKCRPKISQELCLDTISRITGSP